MFIDDFIERKEKQCFLKHMVGYVMQLVFSFMHLCLSEAKRSRKPIYSDKLSIIMCGLFKCALLTGDRSRRGLKTAQDQ